LNSISSVPFWLASLSVYGELKKDSVLSGFDWLLREDAKSPEQIAGVWSGIIRSLAEFSPACSLPDYVYEKVLYSENAFSLACAKYPYADLDFILKSAAEHDLKALSALAYLPAQQVKDYLEQTGMLDAALADQLSDYSCEHCQYACTPRWEDDGERLAEFYRMNGTGVFAKYKAFKFSVSRLSAAGRKGAATEQEYYKSALVPIADPDVVPVSSLKGYEAPRRKVEENTRAFVSGLPANNILLYGDRGTGKSSTVKSMLELFGEKGLRIVEVSKEDLLYLDKLSAMVAEQPLKFIVFIDDLSFNEDDSSISGLKAILEGTLAKRPKNLLIYATSNRRHLIKESFSSRTGDDVHLSDTLQETLSLSDRFGLTVTFEVPGKVSYLQIVTDLAEESQIGMDQTSLHLGAERWAMLHGGRSPRMARQFINSLLALQNTTREESGLPEDL